MPIPLAIPIIIGSGITVIGSVAAYRLTGRDEYSACVKTLIKAGVPKEEAVSRCMGRKEPGLIERAITPLIIIAGIAIAGPSVIEAIRGKR